MFFRKNFSRGVLARKLLASPRYPSDYMYEELKVADGHSLPTKDEVDEDTTFRLVIWDINKYPNPGDDPNYEIVTAKRSTHPNIYFLTRGEEGTSPSEHEVGQAVELHYTAGVSLDDIQPILDMLGAETGSIFYVFEDPFGRKYIESLPPGNHGMVLVTGGSKKRPFWDWIWGAPGALGGIIKTTDCEVFVGVDHQTISTPTTKDLNIDVSSVYNTDAEEYTCQINSEHSHCWLDFSGGSGSEPLHNEEDQLTCEFEHSVS